MATITTFMGLLIVLFLLYEFFGSNLVHSRAQQELVDEFRQSLGSQKAPKIVPGDPIGILSIPKIKLETALLEGTAPSDLERGVGHFRSTTMPGGPGNVVVAGRRTTFGAPFRDLDELVFNDAITVATRRGIFTYFVTEVRVVKPGKPDVVTATLDNRLTLVTSNPPYVAADRLAVIAELEGDPVAMPVQAGPVIMGRDEMGLSGDASALAPLILLAQLLAVAFAFAFFAYRRRVGKVVYVVAAPVLLVVLILAFDQLNRLLPGTL